jgi:hypothetical protein
MADDNQNQLPSIDADMLAAVTGGAADNTEAVTAMLQTLMTSIKDLAASRNSGNDSFMQFLPMMMMMMSRQQHPQVVAAAPVAPPNGPISPGDGWVRVA